MNETGQHEDRNGGQRAALRSPGSMERHTGIIAYGTIPQQTAILAAQLVESWGMRAETPDGEDKSGRQKLRRVTPKELVAEACDTASLLFKEFNVRNWIEPPGT
jgi:hypothetical protein